LVHGRNGGSRGGSAGFGWRIRRVGGGGAFGFGVKVRVEVPGGVAEAVLEDFKAIIDVSVRVIMCGSSPGCCIII
jgi:hypothetical protein